MSKLIWKTDSSHFREIIKNSKSISDVLKFYGICYCTYNKKSVQERIRKEKIDFSHFGSYKRNNQKISNEIIFSENSNYNRRDLKKRIIKENIISYKCSDCGIDEHWNGKKLVLQLDHINGINNDNRIENLRFLCPNCHSQTETFSGKNGNYKRKTSVCDICGNPKKNNKSKICKKCSVKQRQKVQRPDIQILLNMINENGYEFTGRFYGVSGNAIRKWIMHS